MATDHANGRRPPYPRIEAPSSVHGHVADTEAKWAEFDPSTLVALAHEQAPELAPLLAACTRAGWTCRAYAQFVPHIPEGGVSESVILEGREEEYAVDVDKAGRPIGVELLHIAMSPVGH